MKNIAINLLLLAVIALLLLATCDYGFHGSHRDAQKAYTYAYVNGGAKTALDLFKKDCGRYPTEAEGLSILERPPADGSLTNWRGPYLDPSKTSNDAWGHEYIYRFPSTHSTNDYDLYSLGPDGVSNTVDDIGNWQTDASGK